jgi:hypothetical protein
VPSAVLAAVAGASTPERDAGELAPKATRPDGRGNAGSMLSMFLRENDDGARTFALNRLRRFEDRGRPTDSTLTTHRHSVAVLDR